MSRKKDIIIFLIYVFQKLFDFLIFIFSLNDFLFALKLIQIIREISKIFIISDLKKCQNKSTLFHPTTKISERSFAPQPPITKTYQLKNNPHLPKHLPFKNLLSHNQSLMIHSPLNFDNLNNSINVKYSMRRNSNTCMPKVSSRNKTLNQKIELKKRMK